LVRQVYPKLWESGLVGVAKQMDVRGRMKGCPDAARNTHKPHLYA
jgi:hypothetical protein